MSIEDLNLIYYIIIIDVILIFVGLLIAYAIDRFHKNVDETVKLLHIMTEDLGVIIKDIEEMKNEFDIRREK